MYFLKVLQEADSDGGGRSLLGSVVQELREGLFGLGQHYPIPLHMSKPGIIREAIEKQRRKLDLDASDPVVLALRLAATQQSVVIKRKDSFGAGVGPFPGLPANFGLDIDYSLMRQVTLAFGKNTRFEYIPLGYFGRLYQYVDGDDQKVDRSGVIEDNNVVDSILLAKEFHVTFESEKDFNVGFEAKLKAFSSIPGVSAKVAYAKQAKRKIVAKVSGNQYYLVALGVSDWDDFDLT
jgi:hypothetical protein